MDLEKVKTLLLDRAPKPQGNYQSFSVLVPLVTINGQIHLLFEIRSENLKTQPREICFPGGRIEPDEPPVGCAIRETIEELNLSFDRINILGPLDYLVLPYNLILYPFLGTIDAPDVNSINFNKDEVQEIFTVPLDFFINNDPLAHPIKVKTLTDKDFPYHLIQQGEEYHWRSGKYPVYFYSYENYTIWGITARIIKNLIDILKEYSF